MRVTLALLIAAVLAVGCAQDEPTITPPAEQPTAQPPGGDIAAGCEPGSEVVAMGSEWEPRCILSRRSTITVTNEDPILHSFSIRGTDVDVDLKPGATEKIDVSGAVKPGVETEFYCTYHPPMVGDLTVE